MASLAVIQTFAVGNPQLRQRFQAGRLQVAWNISANGSATVAQLAWADKVYSDYSADLEKEYLQFLGTTQVQTAGDSITDNNIIAAITGLVNSDWGA